MLARRRLFHPIVDIGDAWAARGSGTGAGATFRRAAGFERPRALILHPEVCAARDVVLGWRIHLGGRMPQGTLEHAVEGGALTCGVAAAGEERAQKKTIWTTNRTSVLASMSVYCTVY